MCVTGERVAAESGVSLTIYSFHVRFAFACQVLPLAADFSPHACSTEMTTGAGVGPSGVQSPGRRRFVLHFRMSSSSYAHLAGRTGDDAEFEYEVNMLWLALELQPALQ